MKVLTVPGVSKFLWFDGKPCVIKSEEINEIKNFLLNYRGIKPEIHLLPGQMATINKGVFSNHSGQIKFMQGNKAFLVLSSLGCYFTAVVPVNVLEVGYAGLGKRHDVIQTRMISSPSLSYATTSQISDGLFYSGNIQ